MQRIRLSVRENRLTNPANITAADYLDRLSVHGHGWVAQGVEGELAGFAIVDEKNSNLWALFVDERFEGRGVGASLHDRAVNAARDAGLGRLWLTTDKGKRAEGFYRRRGWRDCPHRGAREEIRLELLIDRSASATAD